MVNKTIYCDEQIHLFSATTQLDNDLAFEVAECFLLYETEATRSYDDVLIVMKGWQDVPAS